MTTIEGLSEVRSHPVPQCGHCHSGQIISASALLSYNPQPSDSAIDSAMAGNICRRGTHLRIGAAIHRAAELEAGRAS